MQISFDECIHTSYFFNSYYILNDIFKGYDNLKVTKKWLKYISVVDFLTLLENLKRLDAKKVAKYLQETEEIIHLLYSLKVDFIDVNTYIEKVDVETFMEICDCED